MPRNPRTLTCGGEGKQHGQAGEETQEPIQQHPDPQHLLLVITPAVPRPACRTKHPTHAGAQTNWIIFLAGKVTSQPPPPPTAATPSSPSTPPPATPTNSPTLAGAHKILSTVVSAASARQLRDLPCPLSGWDTCLLHHKQELHPVNQADNQRILMRRKVTMISMTVSKRWPMLLTITARRQLEVRTKKAEESSLARGPSKVSSLGVSGCVFDNFAAISRI